MVRGFPKSMDIEKAINKRNNGESSEIAKQWHGWGTALKPSFESIIVARKPIEGACIDNVLKYGTGGINIDECRIGAEHKTDNGRFPANTILTYDDTDFEEVCGGFPVGKKNGSITKRYKINNQVYGDYGYCNEWEAYDDSGSASRYFMNCKYTERDDEKWLKLLANNVERNLWTSQAIKENIAQMNVDGLLCELKDHYAKYVGNQLDLCEMNIVQDIAEILHWDFKIETSKVMQDFITNYKKCTQLLNLVQFVEKMDSIDTTQTTQNLLKLFGYVKVAITKYIVGNFTVNELDQKRYTYTPKASKKDRNDGLGIETNKHPTIKPTALMQYLVRLVTPKGGTVLDPFMGSGSTGKAVAFENKDRNANYNFIGIELDNTYCEIARKRIEWANNYKEEDEDINQISLFDLGGENNE